MHGQMTVIIIVTITASIVLLIAILFIASIIRRFLNERKYQELDLFRGLFDKKIRGLLDSGDLQGAIHELTAPPQSTTWQAIEDVLLALISELEYQEGSKQLFIDLGYVAFYEKQILSRNVQARALCCDKLGKMKSLASVPKLIALLDAEEPELVSVAIRSLSKIGGREALTAVMERLPTLLNTGKVASKALETDLLAFGAEVVPALLRQQNAYDNPRVAASVLVTLSRLPADPRSVLPAMEQLGSVNAEVRSKALQVLGRPEHLAVHPDLPGRITALLDDPAWYVRLQAIRSLRALGHEPSIVILGKLLQDEKWQVRNEAARAIILLKERALDILLDALTGDDRYAIDSVCEEIENTLFFLWLIEHLEEGDAEVREKARRMLEIMHSHGFLTPFETYLEHGSNDTIKQRIRALMRPSVEER
jgi:HEAT repeats